MEKKILIVEDDGALAMGLEYALKNEGFNVLIANKIEEARRYLEQVEIDIILLDVLLPDGTGYNFCKEIRIKSDIAIIFLTACDEEVNIVMGLDIGGDDYMTKPFRVGELISRIKAVLRRKIKSIEGYKSLISGEIEIRLFEAKVIHKGEEISLTPMEYKLLITFVQHSKQVLSRQQLLEQLWDIDGEFVDDNTLSVYIKRLREKIKDSSEELVYIKTVRGMGYQWCVDVKGGDV